MRPHAISFLPGSFALALLLVAPRAAAIDAAVLPPATADAMAQAASPQAIAEYRRKLREYQEARAGVRGGGRRLLEFDFRKAARAATPSAANARRSRSTITC